MSRAIIAILSLLSVSAAGLAQPAGSYHYTARTTRTVDGKSRTGTVSLWVRDAATFRAEQETDGKRMVTIRRGPDVWSFNPGQKVAYHRRPDAAMLTRMSASLGSPDGPVREFMAKGGKKVGQESVGGVRCDKYRLLTPDGFTHYLWMAPGQRPTRRRQETSGTQRVALGMGQSMVPHRMRSVTDFGDWQFGKPMSDTLFRVPAGVKVQEAPPAQGLPAGHPSTGAMPSGHPPVGGARGRR